MKTKGIVRRIDDLGRLVIPKEIRKLLRLYDGDQIEISLTSNNEILIKKHSNLNISWSFVNDYIISLSKLINKTIIVFDFDNIIVISNNLSIPKTISNKNLRQKLEINTYLKPSISSKIFPTVEQYEYIVPIYLYESVIGGICCFSNIQLNSNEEYHIKTASLLISKFLESN